MPKRILSRFRTIMNYSSMQSRITMVVANILFAISMSNLYLTGESTSYYHSLAISIFCLCMAIYQFFNIWMLKISPKIIIIESTLNTFIWLSIAFWAILLVNAFVPLTYVLLILFINIFGLIKYTYDTK